MVNDETRSDAFPKRTVGIGAFRTITAQAAMTQESKFRFADSFSS
jgi:hypothetical protein